MSFKSTVNKDLLKDYDTRSVQIRVGYLNKGKGGYPHLTPIRERGPDGKFHIVGQYSDHTCAELGKLLSEGDETLKIPPRPHIEEGMEHFRSEIDEQIKKHYESIVATGTGDPEAVGLACVSAVKQYMVSGDIQQKAPNAPMTIERKGSEQPLIDQGQLRNAVEYEIVWRTGKVKEGKKK